MTRYIYYNNWLSCYTHIYNRLALPICQLRFFCWLKLEVQRTLFLLTNTLTYYFACELPKLSTQFQENQLEQSLVTNEKQCVATLLIAFVSARYMTNFAYEKHARSLSQVCVLYAAKYCTFYKRYVFRFIYYGSTIRSYRTHVRKQSRSAYTTIVSVAFEALQNTEWIWELYQNECESSGLEITISVPSIVLMA